MKTHSSRGRFLRAYFSTLKILWRYLFLALRLKISSQASAAQKSLQAHQKTAAELRSMVLSLKGLFVKVGQMLSIMTQFLPEAITKELQGLQDATPPSAFAEIQACLEEEFQQPLTQIFASIDSKPLASASLGQVHRARSHQGQELAVKIRHPGIEKLVALDLQILGRIFKLLHWAFPGYGLKRSFEEIKEVVLGELDFAIEAKNLKKIKENLQDFEQVYLPTSYPELSTSRVLSLEYIHGFKIRDLSAMKKHNIDPQAVAELLVTIYCQQIFEDGLYHADPHPGNFLIQAPQAGQNWPFRLVLLDLGAVSQVSPEMRQGMARFMEGVLKRDTEILSQSMKDMGFIAQDKDEAVFDRIVEFFYERLKDIKLEDVQSLSLDNLSKIENFIELKKLNLSFADLLKSFNVPRDWAILERSLLLLMGLTQHLAPQYNPLETILPYAQNFALGGQGNAGDFLIASLKEALLSYLKLPAELQKTLKSLKKGELKLAHPQSLQEQKKLRRSINQLSYVLLSLGLWQISHNTDSLGPWQEGLRYASLGFGLLFIINFFRKG